MITQLVAWSETPSLICPPCLRFCRCLHFLQSMDEMIDKLVFVSKDNLTYIAEYERCACLPLQSGC